MYMHACHVTSYWHVPCTLLLPHRQSENPLRYARRSRSERSSRPKPHLCLYPRYTCTVHTKRASIGGLCHFTHSRQMLRRCVGAIADTKSVSGTHSIQLLFASRGEISWTDNEADTYGTGHPRYMLSGKKIHRVLICFYHLSEYTGPLSTHIKINDIFSFHYTPE